MEYLNFKKGDFVQFRKSKKVKGNENRLHLTNNKWYRIESVGFDGMGSFSVRNDNGYLFYIAYKDMKYISAYIRG